MKPSTKWRHFWKPSSGIGGGLLFGLISWIVGMVVLFLREGNW